MTAHFEIALKTMIAIFLSGIIGIERQVKHRPAGFRTHILVCIGAMTVMILSETTFLKYYENYKISFDPTRMGAQVISGIGFLGAGTIIHYGSNVKGLTTAATLWVVAAIGLAVGAGQYFLAIIVTGAIYITLFIFNHFSRSINERGNITELTIDLMDKSKTLGEINLLIGSLKGKILDIEFLCDNYEDLALDKEYTALSIRIIVKMQNKNDLEKLITKIQSLNGVINVDKL